MASRLVRVPTQRAAAVLLQPTPLHPRATYVEHAVAVLRRRPVPGLRRDTSPRPGCAGIGVFRRPRGWSVDGQARLQSRAARRAADSYRHDVTWLAHLAHHLE